MVEPLVLVTLNVGVATVPAGVYESAPNGNEVTCSASYSMIRCSRDASRSFAITRKPRYNRIDYWPQILGKE
jgi:hypothetical protein